MQRSFDEMGTPLSEVTFCVIDLETTGASPASCAITEVGAVKVRGGRCLGTFHSLVDPGVPIPPFITVLTGITQAMVVCAPGIDEVLPSLVEFAGGSVIVGHNVRFDLGFLQAALERAGWPRLTNRFTDTCAVARRLLADEVRNCRLSTLADHLRLPHRPSHRALDDAWATTDLLHALLERAGSLGVLGLDDLLALPTIGAHPQVAKLALAARLPRRPGVYLFRARGGRVLYVGKATDLRSRVRSYFSGDGSRRRKVAQLLRQVERIEHVVCATTLEAAVLEVRLIHEHMPPFNRQATLWRRYTYLKLTLDERWPRLSVVRVPRAGDGCLYLGPLASRSAARLVADAIESVVPLRRCTSKARAHDWPCPPAQIGVAACPCSGQVADADYRAVVELTVRGLTDEPNLLLGPLEERMRKLADEERFEEAVDARDRAGALARALARQRRFDTLRRAGRLEVEGAVLVGGCLATHGPPTDHDPTAPLPRELADEVACVAAWLDREAHRLRLLRCEGELASPAFPLPTFDPGRPRAAASSGPL